MAAAERVVAAVVLHLAPEGSLGQIVLPYPFVVDRMGRGGARLLDGFAASSRSSSAGNVLFSGCTSASRSMMVSSSLPNPDRPVPNGPPPLDRLASDLAARPWRPTVNRSAPCLRYDLDAYTPNL